MNQAIFLRRLGRNDAGPYRELRLLALQLHPEAFGSSFEEESSLSENAFAERLDDGLVFGAWSAEQLVGCAGLAQRETLRTTLASTAAEHCIDFWLTPLLPLLSRRQLWMPPKSSSQ